MTLTRHLVTRNFKVTWQNKIIWWCKFDATYVCSVFSGRVLACEELVFNLGLNTGSDVDDETKGGELFQTRAAATKNARSPIDECFDRGMTSAAEFDDRCCCRDSASATWVSSAYRCTVRGAVPCRQRKASTARRYAILSGTRNQWRSVVLPSFSNPSI